MLEGVSNKMTMQSPCLKSREMCSYKGTKTKGFFPLKYLLYTFLKYIFRFKFKLTDIQLSIYVSFWTNEIKHSLDDYLIDVSS